MPDEIKKSTPFFSTPVGLVVLAVLLWALACIAAAAAVIFVENTEFSSQPMQVTLTYLAFGPATFLIVLSIASLLVGAVRWAIFGRNAKASRSLDTHRLTHLLEQCNQRLLLSDTAKRIAYRAEDIAVLQQTIRDDIRRSQFDEAMVLVNELAQTYGQLEKAESYREEIDNARTKDIEAKVKTGIDELEAKLLAHDFVGAGKEAARLQRLYPQSPAVQRLEQRVAASKDQHKAELEREFLKASERDEVDRAIELMTELDKYLTAEEAEPFREVARGVIGKKRDNLGVQFKLAVHDKEWAAAVKAGEQIIKEFPNTRMADEVRSLIDLLRERAAGQQQAQTAAVS
jgi:hypothetical protein